MGIYSNGCIYGVRLYRLDDEANELFEEMQDTVLTTEQMKRAHDFYTQLENKTNVRVQVYTECCSTFNLEEAQYFMMWQPMHIEAFCDRFGDLACYTAHN